MSILYYNRMNLKLQKIVALFLCAVFVVGSIMTANNEILCIGENGHIEFETVCLPSCGEADDPETVCENNPSSDGHNDHSDCSNCIDLDYNAVFWATVRPSVDLDMAFTISFEVLPPIDSYNAEQCFHLFLYEPVQQTLGLGPPEYCISSTVIRC